MPRSPRVFCHGAIKEVTISAEEDLVIPANPIILELLKKCAAQAAEQHNIWIADFLCMANHIHMILGVMDPSDFADFMERFKTESAHAINRLLGRKKRTVWCEGYDCAEIPDLETLIDRIVYIYANPTRANLVDTIEDYPGLNTFLHRKRLAENASASPKERHYTYRLPRTAFTPLGTPERMTERDYARYHRNLIHGRERNSFEVNLNFFMERLGVTTLEEQQEVSRTIVERLREREAEHRERRAKAGKSVLGRAALLRTPIGKRYVPDRKGRKMLVRCVDPVLRKKLISRMQDLIRRGKKVLAEWRRGNLSERYPMGLFPPTGVRLVEPIGWPQTEW